MGIDSWTRTPAERRYRAQTPKRGKSWGDRMNDAPRKAKELWNGEGKKCHCGCGKSATAFRGGKMYNKRCVGPGSGWDKSGLPSDRTPPLTWRHKRNINRESREASREPAD